MTAAPAAPPERAEKALELDPIKVIDAKFPIKSGEYKRIHPLWNSHYRVNFHAIETNVIVRSYFLTVIGGTIRVRE